MTRRHEKGLAVIGGDALLAVLAHSFTFAAAKKPPAGATLKGLFEAT
jgi:hypothetical protein